MIQKSNYNSITIPETIKISKKAKHFTMEQENLKLLEYFDKFKDYHNFTKLKQKLADVSEIRYIQDIQIGDVVMPQIGPSAEINKFHKIIEKEWGEKESQEIKYLLKYYDGGDIENIEEASIILDIKYHETEDENYLKLKHKLLDNKTIKDDDLEFLINEKDIISTSLIFFLL